MKPLTAILGVLLLLFSAPAGADPDRQSFALSKDDATTSQTIKQVSADPVTIPEKLIANLQEDFNLTRNQAAGIAGNLAHESGNFRLLKEINGNGYGYSQWSGSRRTSFRSYAARVGGPDTFEANYGFLRYEMKTQYGPMMNRIRATDDVEKVARIFMKTFLRPQSSTANLTRRVRFAHSYLQDDFGDAGCYSHPQLEGKHRPAACPGGTS